MDKITILPITPNKHNCFQSLLTPLLADIISLATGAKLDIMLNMTGMNANVYSSHERLISYVSQLHRIGISSQHCIYKRDDDESYVAHIKQVVQTLFNDALIYFASEEIAWCECGIVEIPRRVLDVLLREGRAKLDINEYLQVCGEPAVSRMFLALGLQWSNSKSIIDSSELYLVKKSVYPKVISVKPGVVNMDIGDVFKLVHRESILKLLKDLRSNKSLEPDKIILKTIICDPHI